MYTHISRGARHEVIFEALNDMSYIAFSINIPHVSTHCHLALRSAHISCFKTLEGLYARDYHTVSVSACALPGGYTADGTGLKYYLNENLFP